MANYIYIGDISNPSFTFDDDSIMSLTANVAVNIAGDELSYDTLEAQVYYDNSLGELRDVQYATLVTFVRDNDNILTLYLKSIKRVGKYLYDLEAVSFIGIFDSMKFYGGVYRNISLPDFVETVITSSGPIQYKQREYIRTGIDPSTGTIHGVAMQSTMTTPFISGSFEMQFRLVDVLSYSTTEHAIFGSPFGITENGVVKDYMFGLSLAGAGQDEDGENIYELKLSYCRTRYTVFSSVKVGDLIRVYIPSLRSCNWSIEHRDGTYDSGTFSIDFADFIPAYLRVYGGGIKADNSFDDIPYVIDIYKYRCNNSSSASNSFNYVPMVDVNTGEVSIHNTLTGFEKILPGASVIYGSTISSTVDDPRVATFGDTVKSILEKIKYSESVLNKKVHGWLPACTKRDALYNVIFSCCINILRDGEDYIFTFLSPDQDGEISTANIYDSGAVEEVSRVSKISLTEYSLDSYGSQRIVFDNSNETASSDPYIILFDGAPIYGEPVATGLTILSYTANAAIVTGSGSISASTYNISRKVLTKETGLDRGKNINVSNASLVTFVNSDNVMKRLFAYYMSAYKTKCSLVYGNEKCGKKYGFTNPFNEVDNGYLSKIVLRSSSFVKATCDFVCGYTPPEFSNEYTNVALITSNGTWTVPSSVFQKPTPKIRIVLIGGGDGGDSGYAGQNSPNGINIRWRTRQQAKGGKYGNSGSPGKIFDTEIINPASSYNVTIGSGGSGGAVSSDYRTSNKGSSGGNTTFGTYSSASGRTQDGGFLEIFNNVLYAYKPSVWDDSSGSGGNGSYIEVDETTLKRKIVNGEPIYNKVTGEKFYVGSPGRVDGSYYPFSIADVIAPGVGGGAALSANGNSGYGSYASNSYARDYYVVGAGGDGANATYVPSAVRANSGCGGIGGVGGGGAGCVGMVRDDVYEEAEAQSVPTVTPTGGTGGRGGNGSSGIAIIYY